MSSKSEYLPIRHLNQRLREVLGGYLEDGGPLVEAPSQEPEDLLEKPCVTLQPHAEGHCPQKGDSVICWPPTRPGTYAYAQCMSEFHDIKYDTSYNASKFCFGNGTWELHANYDNCTPLYIEPELGNDTTHLTSTLYYIGYSLSLVALLVAMWVFLYFKDLRCLRNTIHTNLMSTFVMTNFMWIITNIWQDSPQSDLPSCAILILLLHYFHITTFFWMFVEGLYLYILVVETFHRQNIKTLVYVAIGWGVPLVIIVIWGLTRALAPDRVEDVAPERNCHWMNATVYDWIFKVPILTVMALNSIFLVMIMWVLITKLRSANNAETQQYMKAAKALMVLIPLLGITYILFIVSFKDGSIFAKVFYCLRAFMLSSQGLLVAFFFCFLNSEVQNTIRHRMESWRTARSLGGRRYTISRDWSPRSRTESIRLYSQPTITPYRKRESCSSEVTTTTTVGFNTQNSLITPAIRISNGSASSQKLTTPFLAVSAENEV